MSISWRRSFFAGLVALGVGIAGTFASSGEEMESCQIAQARDCTEAPLGPTLERVAWGLVKHALS